MGNRHWETKEVGFGEGHLGQFMRGMSAQRLPAGGEVWRIVQRREIGSEKVSCEAGQVVGEMRSPGGSISVPGSAVGRV